jgi:hypothetical protein
MRVRYQRGYLRLGQRKKGPDRWDFLWWDSEPTGVRVRRKAVIGTILQYPNLESAWQASNGLRVSINESSNRQREQAITVDDLVDHYSTTELASDQFEGGKSHATKTIYRDFLRRWVKPAWGSLNIRDVRTIAVENWLRKLLRANGSALAPSTKAKIRNLTSVLFDHAIRHEWQEQGQLHQPQSKDARVEINVLLRVTRDCGHVMQPENIWHFASIQQGSDFRGSPRNTIRTLFARCTGRCKQRQRRLPRLRALGPPPTSGTSSPRALAKSI